MYFPPYQVLFLSSIQFSQPRSIALSQLLNSKQNILTNQFEGDNSNSYFDAQNSLDNKIWTFSSQIRSICDKTREIVQMVDGLQKNIKKMEEDLNCLDLDIMDSQKEESAPTCLQQISAQTKTVVSSQVNNRTHPKIKLMEKIFGKKQYSFKLCYENKFPKILYKQRNFSMRIFLKNLSGATVINDNRISLNLKVFQSNGEEIVLNKENSHFMYGVCQMPLQKGMGEFSKIHPQQVSRNFSGKGVSIIIYATSQQHQIGNSGEFIDASQIQPLIFYNVKVVVKQPKMTKKNRNEKQSESENQH